MEKWKNIGEYEVSNLGNVKSLSRDKMLSGYITKQGYKTVCIKVDGKQKNVKVHRLVANSFIPNSKNKRCVNHKNGIKTDNRVENLEWVTHSENQYHAYKEQIRDKLHGAKSHFSKLTEKEVFEIRRLRKFFTLKELGKIYKVSLSTIGEICNNNSWKHLGGEV